MRAGGAKPGSPEETREFFRARYGRERSEAARTVERVVLGHEVGLNGYTTLSEADRLVECLELSPDSLLLDVGAGCGWPGTHIAESSRCRVVLSDIPVEALRQARRHARRRGVSNRVRVVCAEGAALPFVARSVDAVVHADVLC